MNPTTRLFGAAVSLLITPLALAQAPAPPAPPQEAVDACAGRETGTSCNFQHNDHAVSGTCGVFPGGTTVVCVPPHLHFRFGPPPEALDACKDQQEGTSCQFTAPRGGTIAGICRNGPHGEPLACAPKDAFLFTTPGAGQGGQ